MWERMYNILHVNKYYYYWLLGSILFWIRMFCLNERKPKYSVDYYLTNIIDLLTMWINQNFIIKAITAVRKLCSDKNVYLEAYKEYIQKTNIEVDNNLFIELLIDRALSKSFCMKDVKIKNIVHYAY